MSRHVRIFPLGNTSWTGNICFDIVILATGERETPVIRPLFPLEAAEKPHEGCDACTGRTRRIAGGLVSSAAQAVRAGRGTASECAARFHCRFRSPSGHWSFRTIPWEVAKGEMACGRRVIV